MNSRTALTRALVIVAIVSLVLLAGCGGGSASAVNNQPPAGVTVSPSSVTVQVSGLQRFTATVSPSGANQAVTWSVSGTGCPGASCGTIDAAGRYTAPASVPNPPTVTVTARSVADPSKGATATVTIIPGGDNRTPTLSVAVAPDPSGKFGKFAYVANAGSNNISMYTIDTTTGALTSIGRIAAGTSPASVTVDPSGKFAYVANAGSNNISMYTIDATNGALTSTGTIAAGTNPALVTVDPSGKFAYVANADSNNISMYTIDGATGALTFTGTVAAETLPVSLALAPSGKFAYAANVRSNSISMYTIDATTGALTPTGTVAAGTNPRSVAVDPSDKFAYAANCGDFARLVGDVSMYTINSTTGALTSIGTADRPPPPASGGPILCPFVVAVHPSGKFAYVVDSGENIAEDFEPGVSLYTIDGTSGTLTFVRRINPGQGPTSLAIDLSGKFAYVTNSGSSNVSMYSIDAATGALTLIGTIGL